MKQAFKHKRFRAASLETIDQALAILEEYAEQDFRLTLRQLYYQFVARALLPNTEASYNRLGSLVNDARLAGLIDWSFIEDRTRNLQARGNWGSPAEVVMSCASWFHVDFWEGQENRPEVWVEKEALAGVVDQACYPLDVPFYSCRGYSSQSEMYVAACRLAEHVGNEQRPVIFYLGDHDPSGMDMGRDIEDRLTMFLEGMANDGTAGELFDFNRIALNMDQVDQYSPPPNPAKVTDSRYDKYVEEYGGSSWELDALEPRVLVDLITQHVTEACDMDLLEGQREVEEEGRAKIKEVAEAME